MKKILAALLSFILTFSAFAQKSAIELNDIIVDEQNKIGQRIIDFNYAVEAGEDMNLPLQLILEQTKASISVVENLKHIEGSESLKKTALALFNFYKSIVAKEYREMVDIVKKTDVSDADVTRLNEILADISAREEKIDADFAAQQEAFAQRNGFTLEENELQDKLNQIAE